MSRLPFVESVEVDFKTSKGTLIPKKGKAVDLDALAGKIHDAGDGLKEAVLDIAGQLSESPDGGGLWTIRSASPDQSFTVKDEKSILPGEWAGRAVRARARWRPGKKGPIVLELLGVGKEPAGDL